MARVYEPRRLQGVARPGPEGTRPAVASGSEFRLDPLTREWVAVVGGRQNRPNLPTTECPFCVGGLEAPDPYVVRAFENRWPPLRPGAPIDPEGAAATASGL